MGVLKVKEIIWIVILVCFFAGLNGSEFLCLKENADINPVNTLKKSENGTLIINTRQKEAEFTVFSGDDVVFKGIQTEIQLTEGNYQVCASSRFYLSQTKTVKITQGKKALLSFDLAAYEKEIINKADTYQLCSWTGVFVSAANIIFILNADKKGDSAYKDYQNTNSSAMALDFKSEAKKWDKYKMISGISLSVPVYFTLYSYKNYLKNKAILKEKG